MTAIMKMVYGIVKVILTICWKIVKFIGRPMYHDGKRMLKALGPFIEAKFKEMQEKRAAKEETATSEEDSSETYGQDVDDVGEEGNAADANEGEAEDV